MTHARKTDGNQAEIVKALRAAGYVVDLTHRLGGGFPDLVAWTKTTPSISVPLEVKMPGERLNARENEWWQDHRECLKAIVNGAEQALEVMALADRTVMVVGYV